MRNHLQIEYLYHDVDILEVKLSAWNGRFGGAVKIYVERGNIAKAAAKIEGFPINSTDKREIELGAFGPKFAGGSARLQFSCINLAGHGQVELNIEDDYRTSALPETAKLMAPIEPAAIDAFVLELRALENNLHGKAVLKFSDA